MLPARLLRKLFEINRIENEYSVRMGIGHVDRPTRPHCNTLRESERLVILTVPAEGG
jgi:hypothetical protein